ncbi:flagellin [Lacipirellula parvula]|uniref:Flagellin n=1 Tax=Lacipirellula parvula TaxID=2650471 RepID=A0A5K7X5V4_9BACT|nr:flagellin [Lacipirellula parvula]BBO31878.1 flagellin protein FlaA [Lacipirellula parvula]
MTRINTNVQSLVARNTLRQSNASLEQSLTRLSTGLRINTGKDDPAGLIASENLRSDITSIQRAITNTDRANQVIATADSALGRVSSLLNDIRGLVTESANAGALSDEQLSANQLQVDSSLEALNRIAQTTTFQGRRLLDGSLDFLTTAGSNFGNIADLKIDQANLGATGSVSVSVNVTAAATQGQVNVANIPAQVTGVAASTTATFANTVTQASGAVALDTAGPSGFTLTAAAAGPAAGAEGNGAVTVLIDANASEGTVYDASTNTLTVSVDIAGGNDTVADVYAVINAGTDFVASAITGGTENVTASSSGAGTLTGGRDAGSRAITITAATTGASANGKTVTIAESASVTAGAPTAVVDGSGNITVTVNDTNATDLDDISAAINALADYNASINVGTGDGLYSPTTQTPPVVANTAGGVTASGGISGDVVLELAGSNGAEVLSFGAGTSAQGLADGINLVKDATGVEAVVNGTTLQLVSTSYGSKSVVDLRVISEGSTSTPTGTFTTAIADRARNTGADVQASINGVVVTGDGNKFSINTASLDISGSLTAGFTGTASFTIDGGGALFQLGQDVVSNQQARLGIASVNTAKLGGVSGKLFQLGTGNNASLATDTTTAASIVGEAIDQVTSLRGRLGAFQRTTLETNKNALNDVLVNLSDAESSIRDADFAAESANLTRSQILVQSGTTVLQISNQNPQNVLSLLRG